MGYEGRREVAHVAHVVRYQGRGSDRPQVAGEPGGEGVGRIGAVRRSRCEAFRASRRFYRERVHSMKIIAASLLAVAALSVGACSKSDEASNTAVADNLTVTDDGFADNGTATGEEPGNATANFADPALDNAATLDNGVAANIQ
jgi:hypothetical protein